MFPLLYQIFTATTLLILGIYHLINSTRLHLKSPRDFLSKPIHPLPFPPSISTRLRLLLPFLLISSSLLLSILFHVTTSSIPDPLVAAHSLSSLSSAAVILLFLILSIAVLVSELNHPSIAFPSDLVFAFAAAFFYLEFAVYSSRAVALNSGLESKCDEIAARVYALSSVMCVLLAVNQRNYVVDVGLAGTVILQGMWALQTGMCLYVDVFIPEGCHRLIDVVSGVEGSTKCEVEESRIRAGAVLDLAFVVHVGIVVVIVLGVYGVVARSVAGSRRFGSYEALPVVVENSVVQLKTLSGTQA